MGEARRQPVPVMCLSSRSGISSKSRLSRSTFLSLCSNALVQCATICTISATKLSSGVIFPYHACTNSFKTIARNAYSCRSTSFRLVSGGSSSSIGLPLSPGCCGHSVRRMKAAVALSER